jgi:cobaltochelatase CobS
MVKGFATASPFTPTVDVNYILCEVGYPSPEAEENLLAKTSPKLPRDIREKMVEYSNEIRRLFMGEAGNAYNGNSIEVTLSTRTLIRWADLTVRYQPLAKQGIQPVTYALDRALGFRASRETKAMLHELAQRIFPVHTGNGSGLGE